MSLLTKLLVVLTLVVVVAHMTFFVIEVEA